MKILVPLAGPDFERPDGSVKAEHLLGDMPILRAALESRPWWRRGIVQAADLNFILRDTPASRRFASEGLQAWYPGATVSFLGATTRGAALSSLVGLAPVAHVAEPLCIDLADIIFAYDSKIDWFDDVHVGAVAMTFAASHPEYSYLRRDDAGRVVEAAEKRVISAEASAGVYLFRGPAEYLRSLSYGLAHPEEFECRGLFFVCPLLNGIIAAGLEVVGVAVTDVLDIKLQA